MTHGDKPKGDKPHKERKLKNPAGPNFRGWRVDGVLYPPDKPPPAMVEAIYQGMLKMLEYEKLHERPGILLKEREKQEREGSNNEGT